MDDTDRESDKEGEKQKNETTQLFVLVHTDTQTQVETNPFACRMNLTIKFSNETSSPVVDRLPFHESVVANAMTAKTP